MLLFRDTVYVRRYL